MQYVIIGNSTAGISAAENIRRIDQQGEITIISNEPYHTYSRPLISYLLSGKVTEADMKYRGNDFYDNNNCTLKRNALATRIDAKEKYVALADGEHIPYDKLLVATGASAFIPSWKGLETVKHKYTFMSMDDTLRLNDVLDESKRVLIIGAGLIGLKCAEGIAERTSQITIIDLAPRVLPSILDEDGAKRVQSHLESNGLKFHLSCNVKCFNKNLAITADDKEIEFDILVIAAGVQPNIDLLKDIALIDKGIIINEKSETSVPDIYAAGDCTQTLDISSGQNKIMALLPNAYMQGECAGINMAGGKKSFDQALPMNALGFFGLHMITAGNYTGDIVVKDDINRYKRFFYSNNRLNGYILIGNVEKAGIYTSLIREQTPIDSIDFPLICEKPGLNAFTKEARMIKLGGGLE